MKKKLLSLILCLIVCMSVFTGCSLVERNDKNYFEAVVGTISYVDGTTDEITKRELLMGYNSYGYNYEQNYGYTKQKAIETTLNSIVEQRLTIKAVENFYKEANKDLKENDKKWQPVLAGSETTYLWDETYNSIYGNLKSYFNEIEGISDSEDEEKPEENKSVYVPYESDTYLEEVDVMSDGKDGNPVKVGSQILIKKKTVSQSVRDSYQVRKNANGQVYDFEKENFKDVMYKKLMTFTQSSDASGKAWKSALNKYLKDVKENYSYMTFDDDEECFKFEMKRVYDILKNNYMVEKYTDIFNLAEYQDVANVTVDEVLKYYSAKVRADYTDYVLNGKKADFEKNVLDSVGDVDYVLEEDNGANYGYVGYVKLAFDEEQTEKYNSLKDNAYLTPTQVEEEIDKLYASVKATVRNEKGEVTDEKIGAQVLLNRIKDEIAGFSYTGNEEEDAQIAYDKAEAFRKYLYLYNDDDTLKGAERNTVFGVKANGEVLANETFAEKEDVLDAIKKLFNDGKAKVGDMSELVRADDGIYIFFYAGKLQNLFKGIDENFDASRNENNIEVLASTRLNIFSEKTVFDSIYETLKSDNFTEFKNMDMQRLKSKLVVEGGIKSMENNLKDLY